MFRQIRWRLVGWTVLVLGLILALVGGTLYFAMAHSLADEVDLNLARQGEQLAAQIRQVGATTVLPVGNQGYRGGFFYLVVDSGGRPIANPQQVDVSALGLTLPSGLLPEYATITLHGDPVRVYARRLTWRQASSPIVVVGQSTAPEQATLQRLLAIVLAAGIGGLLLSLLGAWFLAGRALVPIQQAFRQQQDFVADASHELRTPLTVLRSAHDLLDQHRAEPLARQGALLDDIRAELDRMARLTDDLLTLAQTDRGAFDLAVGEVDLAALAADTVRRSSPLAAERGAEVVFRADDFVHLVEADPDRLQQVLLILVDNALKHTPSGGTVRVSVLPQGGGACVEVADDGEGIAPEHLPRLFDRFYRADRARSRQRGGTGLGLAIARSLVEAHGGSLTITSSVGVGTTARVRLPAIRQRPSLMRRLTWSGERSVERK